MDVVNRLLDQLLYAVIIPVFDIITTVLNLVLIRPLVFLDVPVWLHTAFLGVLTAFFALGVRSLLRVESRTRRFNEIFSKKRENQKKLQLVRDKYSREAMYRVTDDELNDDFNTFLAHHYVRYTLTYLLPVFLILAWLNSVFSKDYLVEKTGTSFALSLPDNRFDLKGLSVTFVFLAAYIIALCLGFYLKKYLRHPKSENCPSSVSHGGAPGKNHLENGDKYIKNVNSHQENEDKFMENDNLHQEHKDNCLFTPDSLNHKIRTKKDKC
ncbi:MAG: hypothetical protein R6U68_11530 [Desulfobacteraceae bacterium]